MAVDTLPDDQAKKVFMGKKVFHKTVIKDLQQKKKPQKTGIWWYSPESTNMFQSIRTVGNWFLTAL